MDITDVRGLPIEVGHRIRLIEMPDEPRAVPVGTTGRVRRIIYPDRYTLISVLDVDWDMPETPVAPRAVSVIPSVDRVEIIA